MPKSHVVKLMITNKTPFLMKYKSDWFDSGRIADGWSWPEEILPGDTEIIECYEKDNALAGCSGYVTYNIGYDEMTADMTIAFSNPSSGKNKLGVGKGKAVWDNMSDHGYKPFTEHFVLEGRDRPVMIICNCQCTGGEVNQARILLVHF